MSKRVAVVVGTCALAWVVAAPAAGHTPTRADVQRAWEERSIFAQQPLAMLKYALHLQGISWPKIKVIDAGGPDAMYRAFREGRGDFVHLQGPAPQQLEEDGHGHVVACVGDAMPPLAFSSLMAMPAFLKSDKARAFIHQFLAPIEGTVRVPIRSALGRVLAEDVLSPVDVPAHRNSAMDGWAMRGADLKADGETTLDEIGRKRRAELAASRAKRA